MQLFSVFIQDEIALVPDQLYLTVGSKLEHNYYTGFNALPSARVAWTPSTRHMFWAAVSRAERTPAETDRAIRVNFGGFQSPGEAPTLFALVGNPHFLNEGMIAYEAGYRNTLLSALSLDVATYYNDYNHQQTTEPAAAFFENSPAPPHLVVPVYIPEPDARRGARDRRSRRTGRLPIAGRSARVMPSRRSIAPRSAQPGCRDRREVEGSTPAHSAQLRSHVELGRGIEWDVSGYFVDRLKTGIPSYTRLDTGLTWRWTEALSMSVVGQNLIKDRRLEFVDDSGSVRSTLIKRSVYAKFTWQF